MWRDVPVPIVGALLAPGRRMVSLALSAVGLSQMQHVQHDHRVLSWAVWSSVGASHMLLGVLLATFTPEGPLVLGIDETVERRRGAKTAAAGIFRDSVRSSRSHFVKVNGLRWVCLMEDSHDRHAPSASGIASRRGCRLAGRSRPLPPPR
jgi:hypothetical protein